jgi:hypothetical protein
MKQLEGIVKKREEIKVYKISKSLYGFCQGPIWWYTKIDTYLKHQSLKRNKVDYNLYYMKNGIKIVILLYVDHLLTIGSDATKIKWLIAQLKSMFEMINFRLLKFYLIVKFNFYTSTRAYVSLHIISLLIFSINLGWLIVNLFTLLYQKVLHLPRVIRISHGN